MEQAPLILTASVLGAIMRAGADGDLVFDTEPLRSAVSRAVGVIGVRVAVASASYFERDGGAEEPDTRMLSGIWWLSRGNDTAWIGGFSVEGQAMTISTEGEGKSPLVEDIEILDRATGAIASQYAGSEVIETGLVRIGRPAEMKHARVVVTRDYRVRRPQDLLEADQYTEFEAGRLGLAVVQLIGGAKALVVKHRV